MLKDSNSDSNTNSLTIYHIIMVNIGFDSKDQSFCVILARLTRYIVSMTSLIVNLLFPHSAASRTKREYLFLSLITRTITCCNWSKLSVLPPSATLRVSLTMSYTRSRCLLS